MEIPVRVTVLSINKCTDKEIGIGANTKSQKHQVFNTIMNTWSVILTWICLTTNCRSDGNDVRTMDRRLLLNDPNTLLSHIEALQREVTSLKSQVSTLNTSQRIEIEELRNNLKTINLKGTFLKKLLWLCINSSLFFNPNYCNKIMNKPKYKVLILHNKRKLLRNMLTL